MHLWPLASWNPYAMLRSWLVCSPALLNNFYLLITASIYFVFVLYDFLTDISSSSVWLGDIYHCSISICGSCDQPYMCCDTALTLKFCTGKKRLNVVVMHFRFSIYKENKRSDQLFAGHTVFSLITSLGWLLIWMRGWWCVPLLVWLHYQSQGCPLLSGISIFSPNKRRA